ncbi:MAG TPA: hypothetical protein VFB13_20135 [Reyranella sp.]|nr:hypothetical protein [Reyranella sp.]
MPQFIAAVFGFAAGAFAWSGDPLVAFLVGLCALVWVAITSGRVPPWTRSQKQIHLVRPE